MKQAVKEALRETIEPMIAQIGEQIKQLVEGANARLAASEQRMAQFDDRISALEGGGVPADLTPRVAALEARAERHRLRIRWLERWAHSHWPGWLPRPGL